MSKRNKHKVLSLLYLTATTVVENPQILDFTKLPQELYGLLYNLIGKSNFAKQARQCSYKNCKNVRKEFSETCRFHTVKLIASPNHFPIAPNINIYNEELFIHWFFNTTHLWEWLTEECKHDVFCSRGYTMRYRIHSSSVIPQGTKELYRILVCGEWSFHDSAKEQALKLLKQAPDYAMNYEGLSVYNILKAFIGAFDKETERMNNKIIPIWEQFKSNPTYNPITKRPIRTKSMTFKRLAMKLHPYLYHSKYQKEFNTFLQKYLCNIYVAPLRTKTYTI